ncbi:MAG: cation transporter [Oscillospiraceae bacterium]|nr:cation transporter [Oscillospiraceae bacterium]
MISLLSKLLISNREKKDDPAVRRAYGVLCGTVGILLNLLLFAAKLLAGLLSGSIAMTADAVNNLSDAGSSVITLIGFRLAGQKPDPDHPFGHGRIEYLSGLAVAMIILLMGFELLKSSIGKIANPEPIVFHPLALLILAGSIAVKFYMFFYNRAVGKQIDSAAMRATGTDSLSDAVATFVVLLSVLIAHATNLQLDGYFGVLVSLFIFYAGFNAAKETISPLLGQAPDPELVERITDLVLSDDAVVGIHDLVIHDYGPGRMMVSLHAEVLADQDLSAIHDAIDNIERTLCETLRCEATIHMDPIVTDDAFTNDLRAKISLLVADLDQGFTLHDFRVVSGPTHTNVIFDLVVPYTCKESEAEIKAQLEAAVQRLDPTCFAVIKIDRSYL